MRSLALGLLKAWREAVKSERNGTSAAVGPVRNSQQQQTTKRPTPYPRPGTASTSGSGRHMLPPSSFFGAQAPSGPTVDEALRGRVRSCLHTALGGSHEGLGNGSREAGAAHADSGSDDGMLAAAFGIEDEMHSRLAHMAPKAYRQKARELQANLRRNAGLRVAVLDGRLAPEQLLNMTPDQLGGEHL